MNPLERLARIEARNRYLRTLHRHIGPVLRWRVCDADNDNWHPIGA